jgi:hypothetical protein
MWPDANIGIATGGGRAVLDIDLRNGGDGALASLEAAHGRELPGTAKVATGGGGWHHYFAAPAGTRSRDLAPGVELKGEGSYVVAPPSLHASGREYVWIHDGERADAPAWLLEAGQQRRNGSAPPVEEAIPEGQRNSKLLSLAGSMRRRGMGPAEIEAALEVTNTQRCQPPLDADEVRRIAGSVQRYDPEESATAKETPGGYDPQTGRPISEVPAVERLSRLLEGPAVRRVVWRRSKRSAYIFTVLDPRTGEEVLTHSVDDVLVLSNLQKAIHSVTGMVIEAPRRNSETWKAIQRAITAAAEVVEVGDEDAEEWRFRLGQYLSDRVSESPQTAAELGEPFERDGRIHLNRPSFQHFLRVTQRMRAETTEVSAALHELGFDSDPRHDQNYTKPDGKRGNRSYWASPQGWTW